MQFGNVEGSSFLWHAREGTGTLTTLLRVQFPRRFADAPQVIVNVDRADVEPAYHRLLAFVREVSPTGFDLELRANRGARVRAAKVRWLAYPSGEPTANAS